MKAIMVGVFLVLGVLLFTACGTPPTNSSSGANASTAKPTAVAPTRDALLALDQHANEAYIRGDAKFLEGMLSDKLVMHEGGERMDKAAVLRLVAGTKCSVKDWRLDEPQMAKIDPDTYVLSYRGNFDGSCTGPGSKLMKIPSPTRAATVWVRSGDKWLAAYHGENLIIDPKNAPPPKPRSKTAEGNASSAPPSGTDPSATSAMLAVEKKIWEAWMAKDRTKLDELTTPDLAFENIFGTYFANKAETLKDWTGPACDVKSVDVADGAGSFISPTVGVLTSKGTAKGTCGGPKPAEIRVYGTSFYVKDGGAWKLAFCLNRPLS